ncbi:MAG TPA: carbohydrate kinase [Gemmatimonadaceae bacterium]|nr:carbohydrate kinase [Gemmatimonadaceae bacterium]
MAGSEILCVGEVLWDSLPAGLFLGGAPFNVACHLRATGLPVTMVSRVGADRLGEEALRRATRYGVGIDLVQVDPLLPTGFVRVTVSDAGEPAYDIIEPAAWDAIAPTDALLARAARARAIVFGSLAQRNAVTRGTIERLWETEAALVFDVNLRPPYDDPEVVRRSLQHATFVKASENELRRMAGWFDLPGADDTAGGGGRAGAKKGGLLQTVAALAETFGCDAVCVTRGRRGAALWRDGRWTDHPGFEVEVRDTVGAGDAFLAVLLAGLLTGADDRTLLRHANLIGAYVTTQRGALPADQSAAVAEIVDAVAAPPAAAAPSSDTAARKTSARKETRGTRAASTKKAPRRKKSDD